MSIAHEQDPKRRPGYSVALALCLMTLATGALAVINSQKPGQYTLPDTQGYVEYIPTVEPAPVGILPQPLNAPTLSPDAGFSIVDGINPVTEGINIHPGNGFINEGFSVADPTEFDHIHQSTTNLTEVPMDPRILQSDPRIAGLYEASTTYLKKLPPFENLFSYRLFIQEQRGLPQETRLIEGVDLSPGETIDYAYQKLQEGDTDYVDSIAGKYLIYLHNQQDRNLITQEEYADAATRAEYWQAVLYLHKRALNDLWTMTQTMKAFDYQGPVDWSKSPKAHRLYSHWYVGFSDGAFELANRMQSPEDLDMDLIQYIYEQTNLINALTALFAPDLRELFLE